VISQWNFGEAGPPGPYTSVPDTRLGEDCAKRGHMYVARFSYDVLPINREQAIDFIRREVLAASRKRLKSRLLVPLTRAHGGAALQFEVELQTLDQFEVFRHGGVKSRSKTSKWMKAFSKILLCPPAVELLRIAPP
jgi:hypothetical protein